MCINRLLASSTSWLAEDANESGQQKDAPHAKYVARNVMAAHAACACAYSGGAVSRERRSCMRYRSVYRTEEDDGHANGYEPSPVLSSYQGPLQPLNLHSGEGTYSPSFPIHQAIKTRGERYNLRADVDPSVRVTVGRRHFLCRRNPCS